MTMVPPLGSSADTFGMPCGFDSGDSVDLDGVESGISAGDWGVPAAITGLDSGLSLVGDITQDDNNNNSNNKETVMDTDDWPVSVTPKRKSPPVEDISTTTDLCDLFFQQPAKKLSLFLNTKLRYKEERKRVLKLSIAKLRQIDDPEIFLRRSVLINNTIRRLHREVREEKLSRNSRLTRAPFEEVVAPPPTPAPVRRRSEEDESLTYLNRTPSTPEEPQHKRPRIDLKETESRFDSTQEQSRFEKRENSPVVISEIEKQYSQYSCGQSSIFGELQSVVFHSLIASLES